MNMMDQEDEEIDISDGDDDGGDGESGEDEEEDSSEFSASIFDEEEVAEVADRFVSLHDEPVYHFINSEEDTEDDEGDIPDSASSDDHDRSVENSDILVDDYERYNF